MKEKICQCSNPNCKWPIYKGDQVWKGGGKLYCHILCFMDSGMITIGKEAPYEK